MKKITLTAAFLFFLSINSFAFVDPSIKESKHYEPALFIGGLVLAGGTLFGIFWYVNRRYQKKKNDPTRVRGTDGAHHLF